jgi:hypothetical protein
MFKIGKTIAMCRRLSFPFTDECEVILSNDNTWRSITLLCVEVKTPAYEAAIYMETVLEPWYYWQTEHPQSTNTKN